MPHLFAYLANWVHKYIEHEGESCKSQCPKNPCKYCGTGMCCVNFKENNPPRNNRIGCDGSFGGLSEYSCVLGSQLRK